MDECKIETDITDANHEQNDVDERIDKQLMKLYRTKLKTSDNGRHTRVSYNLMTLD